MESLYRKYRPLTFESVVGQQHIVSTLQHAVTEGRLSHAYLFCGPRGTGKTTMARILAKALLCQKAQGDHGCMPDGTCPECEAIAEGAHPDVYELDAASRTGVDSVREEIINSVNFAPVRGTYKVYIIDEVHMLTTQAFNALLKTLEEPPSHVVFVLCTTDPQKLLDTILSRCQRFDFHRISNEDILARMRYVCEQEGFSYDEEALEIVAKHARGGMRDALSTLEQLSVFGGGSVRLADARSLLGEVSSTILAQFASGIASRDVVELFGLVRTQVDEGNDLMELTRDLVGHVRDVYTAFVAGAKPELLDCTPEEAAALKEEASLFENADRLARVLTVLDDAALEMRNASDMRLVLEIALTRLARPESDLTLVALAERLDRLEARIASGVPGAPMDAAALAALGGAVASASSTGASRPASGI
ncbi:DNA polymerase III subunit gamma/tau [Collinsella tanakaei]|uniref:DNA polymerase III subunit gamma/tau n=1 Tax=Collinsella tanakaei YIT 12063 TaxID=742742 RepID=G1WII6_9ACTN|nr:DNA polymerase III subunit gamma/tau [Collinsella tanakaei]EGX71022.1 DNA polymerase III [Collinsella tanakaei YIT 12063]